MKNKILLIFVLLLLSFGKNKPNPNHLAKGILCKFAYQMAKENVYVSGYTLGESEPFKNYYIAVISHEHVNLTEARKIYIDMFHNLVNLINNNKVMEPYLDHYQLSINNLKLVLSFRTDKYNDYTDGSITYMFNVKNNIYYYCSSETMHLIELHDELYEEALVHLVTE